jgi:hypothetical protein
MRYLYKKSQNWLKMNMRSIHLKGKRGKLNLIKLSDENFGVRVIYRKIW